MGGVWLSSFLIGIFTPVGELLSYTYSLLYCRPKKISEFYQPVFYSIRI